jgi:transcriptional regulator with XRE-family HTH domain
MAKSPVSLFGQRLREARLRADLPQDRLGVSIGLDETTASARISRYETGVHEPPFDTAKKIAEILKIPTAYFYCDDDELAAMILVWRHLPKSERKRLRQVLDRGAVGPDHSS